MKVSENQDKDKCSLLPRKKRRQLERKLIKAKKNAWHHGQKIPMSINNLSSTIELQENTTKKKKKHKKKKSKNKSSELATDEKTAKEIHRKILIEDNETEDTYIKKLEKLLGIKPNRKTYLRGFINDGLDYLLDFCDEDRRKEIMKTEADEKGNVWYDEQDEDQQWLINKQKEKINLANQKQNNLNNIETEEELKERKNFVKFNEYVQTKIIDDDSDNDETIGDDQESLDENYFDQQEEYFNETDNEQGNNSIKENQSLKEDIYGRIIDNNGNIIKHKSVYIPPALRQKLNSSDDDSIIELKRRLQGQLNRLISCIC